MAETCHLGFKLLLYYMHDIIKKNPQTKSCRSLSRLSSSCASEIIATSSLALPCLASSDPELSSVSVFFFLFFKSASTQRALGDFGTPRRLQETRPGRLVNQHRRRTNYHSNCFELAFSFGQIFNAATRAGRLGWRGEEGRGGWGHMSRSHCLQENTLAIK